MDDPDDAAVWRIDDERALVVTTDFFTPVVDDPYDYGAIAAANSLSDVYAMGGKPFLALNILGLPPAFAEEVGAQILLGGAEIAKHAGVALAGGHTIQDEEPKYGLIVLGFVHPEKMITKTGALPGDKLFLTKPLGAGVITSALKKQVAEPEDVAEVVSWMTQLNDKASELAQSLAVRGGTDVTGFSFLGHAVEMASGSGVRLVFNYSKIPILEPAKRYGQEWHFPGGASDNRLFFEKDITFTDGLEEWEQMLLFDPQTNGGLLLSVPGDKVDQFKVQADEIKLPVWEVGQVVAGSGVEVVV